MEAKIIFKDGTELVVEQNGTCFIATTKPTFPEDLSKITVESDHGMTFVDAYLIECASIDGRYWFAFGQESQQDKIIRELREQNDLLTESVLEMSEIVYAE